MKNAEWIAVRRSWVLGAAVSSLLCVLGVLAPLAEATPQMGVSQSFRDFGQNGASYNPTQDVTRSVFWAPLQISRLRVVVPWDIAGRLPSDGRRQEFQAFLDRANALGAEPFVVFGPSERSPSTDNVHGHWTNVQTRRTNPTGHVAPTATVYELAIKDFVDTWGPGQPAGVRWIGAWNEPNRGAFEMSLPGSLQGKWPVYLPGSATRMQDCTGTATTNCGPVLAAYYWNRAATKLFQQCVSGIGTTCDVIAGEFAASAGTLGSEAYTYWTKYWNKIYALSLIPYRWSFHAHRDVEALGANITETGDNHDCKAGQRQWCVTHTFRQWMNANGLGSKGLWNTETGAQHASGTSNSTADVHQNNRYNDLIEQSDLNNVNRLYYFNFQTAGENDRGWIDQGTTVNTGARPIWNTVRCRLTPTNCPAWSPPPSGGADFSGDGKADVIGIKPDGSICLYRGDGAGWWLNTSCESLGGGWNVFDKVVGPGDFSGDGKADVIGIKPDGSICLYRGDGAGWWLNTSCESLGGGWNVFDKVVGPGDFSGDGKADVIGIKPDGSICLYRGDGAGWWLNTSCESLGGGWNVFDKVVGPGDFSGDGKADVIGIKPDGSICLYRGDGAGWWLNTSCESLGGGWNVFDKVVGPGDFSGDGKADVIGIKPDGSICLYRGDGAGWWLNTSCESLGGGWNVFDKVVAP